MDCDSRPPGGIAAGLVNPMLAGGITAGLVDPTVSGGTTAGLVDVMPAGGTTAGLVEVMVAAPGWRAILPRVEALARRAVLATLADQSQSGHVTLLLTDDAEIRRLNAGFRGREKATNVLSFPAGMGALSLGDLAISLGVTRREALAESHTFAAHFAHLVVHGTLHLLGHDHLTAGEAMLMERSEARILHRLRLPNPRRVRWAA